MKPLPLPLIGLVAVVAGGAVIVSAAVHHLEDRLTARLNEQDPEPMAVVHIASPAIVIDGRVRQRCGWCGAVIDDTVVANTAVFGPVSDRDSRYPTWPAGAYVAISEGMGEWTVTPPQLGLPPGCCAALDPAITR